MNEKKPTTIQEYGKWLKTVHGVEISDRTENHYDTVVSRVREDFGKWRLWTDLLKRMQRLDQEYLAENGFPLWTRPEPPEVVTKPFDSFYLKTYRKNILTNDSFPQPPPGGWILPENWFSAIDDTVRTCFVVKYLDGVEFAVAKIEAMCVSRKIRHSSSFEAREEGYYAAHISVRRRFEIPTQTWDTQQANIGVEIQITTQLQDTIRRLLHKYYEARRAKLASESEIWQWNYESDEFAANYLGHILHYVEGMIMDVRKRQGEGLPAIRRGKSDRR